MRPLTLTRLLIRCGILALILFAVVVVAMKLGAVQVSLYGLGKDLISLLLHRTANLSSDYGMIVLGIRLPRILLAVFVGASLSVAGVSFQALLRNPLADPYVLGISSGAALGAIVALIVEARLDLTPEMAGLITPVGAFLGAAVTIAAVYILGRRDGQIDSTTLLNLLLAGEKEAMHLGVDVPRVRIVVYIAASILTGLAVSVSGTIGYVGLLVPHVMRLIFGSDHRMLIPASALGGAIALVIADTLARTVTSPTDLPVGAMTALAGAPLFIYLLRRRIA